MRYSIPALLRVATAPLAIAGLLTLGLPPQSATARTENAYQDCAAALRDSGIADAQVAAACSAALRPIELATCVSEIGGQTAIAPTDALSGCRRVRRPLEYSTCVVSINPADGATAAVLDNCRRSLLPARFSECVVGLVTTIDINTNRAMRSCIASTDSQPDGLPTQVNEFAPESEPVTPAPITPPATPNPSLTPPAPTPNAPTPNAPTP